MRRRMCMGILRWCMIKEENIMMKKIAKTVCLATLGLLFLVGMRMPVQAGEADMTMTLQKTVKEADIKEAPDQSAETLKTVEEGTGVIVYGEPQDSWSQVEYDGAKGYMESGALESYMDEEEAKKMEEEFETVGEETVRLVEESELIRKSRRTSAIWGGIIAVLVATIFVVGIVSAIKKEKEGEAVKAGEEEKEGETVKAGEEAKEKETVTMGEEKEEET